MTAALLAGCADSSRFLGNPLGNPFHSASNAPVPGNYDLAPPPYNPPRSTVSRRALPPSDYEAPRRVASYETPAHDSPRLSPRYKAPRTERTGSIAPASGHGNWTSDGGMAVIAASGESAAVLAERYNVPTDALLRSNGFTSASQVHAGTRVVIPVYNANGGGSHVAEARPVHEAREQERATDHRSKLEQRKQDKAAALAEAKAHDREIAAAKREKAAAYAEAKAHDHEMALAKLEQAKHDKAAALAEKTHGREAAVAKLERAKKDKALALAEAKAHDREMAMAKLERARKEKVAALAEAEKKGHGREKAMAKLERMKAEKAEKAQMLADAKEARKARIETAKSESRAKAAQPKSEIAEVETVREKPAKGARVEERKVAAVDTEPTASLPPAAEKVSANGNPEFRWPAHGRIIQGFKSGGNDGINIAVPEGTSVKAAESGVVAYAGSEIKGFGNLVLIRHPNGFVTAYANNGDIEVRRGEQVKRGQVIAKSGQSGNVASPQLHFELRKGSTPVDPTRYLAGA